MSTQTLSPIMKWQSVVRLVRLLHQQAAPDTSPKKRHLSTRLHRFSMLLRLFTVGRKR
ncbi:MAG: hypothetical protein R8G66_09745 [Cytophagales bacterium]|nr:hypothetical protein [Cytophagales bacterium]